MSVLRHIFTTGEARPQYRHDPKNLQALDGLVKLLYVMNSTLVCKRTFPASQSSGSTITFNERQSHYKARKLVSYPRNPESKAFL